MKYLKSILLILVFQCSFVTLSQLGETIWNFPPHFLKNAEVGSVLKLRDGTYSCGVEFKSNGNFERIGQIIYYENQRVLRKPDSAHGTWELKTVNEKQYLILTFSKQSQLKFEVLEFEPNWLKLRVVDK